MAGKVIALILAMAVAAVAGYVFGTFFAPIWPSAPFTLGCVGAAVALGCCTYIAINNAL